MEEQSVIQWNLCHTHNACICYSPTSNRWPICYPGQPDYKLVGTI